MTVLGLGLSAALLLPWEGRNSIEAGMSQASLEVDEANPVSEMEVEIAQAIVEIPTLESIIDDRKAMLAQRIAQTYRRPLADIVKIVDYAHISGEQHSIDPVLLLAIAAVESSFNPKAVSSAGAQGLIQALPRAHPEKFARLRASGKSPFDPDASMDMGGQIYAEYRAKFKGDQILALQQYNGSLKDKSRRYSNKVMAMHRQLNAGLPALPDEA